MTIRQLAETAGCGINTVKRLAKMIYPDVRSDGRGIALDFTREQSLAIMQKLPKKNFIGDPADIQNDIQMGQVNIAQMGQVDYSVIEKMIAQAVTAAMIPIIQEIRKPVESKEIKALPAPKKTSRDSLRQLISKYAQESLDNDYREAWSHLYEELYYVEHVSIRRRSDTTGRSKLDCIEDAGLLDSAHSIVLGLMGE